MDALDEHAAWWKRWDADDQPRVPAGESGGGQWAKSGGTSTPSGGTHYRQVTTQSEAFQHGRAGEETPVERVKGLGATVGETSTGKAVQGRGKATAKEYEKAVAHFSSIEHAQAAEVHEKHANHSYNRSLSKQGAEHGQLAEKHKGWATKPAKAPKESAPKPAKDPGHRGYFVETYHHGNITRGPVVSKSEAVKAHATAVSHVGATPGSRVSLHEQRESPHGERYHVAAEHIAPTVRNALPDGLKNFDSLDAYSDWIGRL